MLDTAPASQTKRRTTRPLAALFGVLALVLAFVLPEHAQAASSNPTGTLETLAVAPDGSVTGSGWTADTDAPTTVLQVKLSDNGVPKTSVLAGAARSDVAAVYPAFGANHGFSFQLVLGNGSHQVCVTAQNVGPGADSQLGCRTFTIANDPTGTIGTGTLSGNTVTFAGTAADPNTTGPVTVRAYVNGSYAAAASSDPATHGYRIAVPVAEGSNSVCLYAINVGQGSNIQLGCQPILVRNNPFGSLDGAFQTPAGVLVTGWAIDLNTTASLTVSAYVDGKYAGQSSASGPRPDVAQFYPSSGPNHGYSMLLAMASGSHTVCVSAVNVGPGSSVQLRCTAVTVQNNPIGSVEGVSQLPAGVQVSGWALDLNSAGPVTVNISADGRLVASVAASLGRSDVAARYPSVGANHGYSVLLNLAAGTHTVCVDAINVGPGVNSRLRCATVAVRNNPLGALETAAQVPGGIKVAGWALDLNTAAPIVVAFYLDGRFVQQVPAAAPHAGLATSFPAVGGNHGFGLILGATPGSHQLCAYGINYGPGASLKLGCANLNLIATPMGNLEGALQAPGGALVSGWAMDRFSSNPLTIRVYVDAKIAAIAAAAAPRPDVAALFPNMGANHGFVMNIPMPVGTHRVCTYIVGRSGAILALRCVQVSRSVNPVGGSSGIARVGTSNVVAVSGWAVDPDTTGPITVQVTSDGVPKQTLNANQGSSWIAARWPAYGPGHAYSAGVTLDPGEHQVCVIANNVGAGGNSTLGCTTVLSSGDGVPAAPTSVTALAGSRSVTLSWVAPRSINAPITSYQVVVVQHTGTMVVAGSATGAVVNGLTNGGRYTFTVRAVNAYGRGSAAVTTATPTNIPPQVTPAPVSTSHYLRNLTGNLASDAAIMRAMGATDASRNPSGHSYLVLLQIGGQDEINKGALLSATSRFVSYAAVVSASNAYLDGYASRQLPYAPLTLAIGTNNDVDVSLSAGVSWARNVINPVVSYAVAHHPGMIIAGANDMEPGFSATATQTRAWLSGYLAGTSASFVFNGSADGCSTGAAGSRCNNGWSMADLQWLSGGAAAARTVSLPQIYNYAMPLQWKFISLTGVSAGRARINFGGPLTELTACAQAGSCGSISNVVAWSQLWNAISSSAATRQSQLPHGTDLRIN